MTMCYPPANNKHCTVGGYRVHKHLDISIQQPPTVGHTYNEPFETKKSKIGPSCNALGLFLLPGGLEHPQVPWESLFEPKLKIYVETLYCEHF